MRIEFIIQYVVMAIFLLLLLFLLLRRKDSKQYIPVALFAIVYADIWCYVAEYLKIWSYPTRLFADLTIVSIPFNYTVLPAIVILWIMYCPNTSGGKIVWILAWPLFIIFGEFIITRYSDILDYKNGFDIHISFILWIISWYIFLKFHLWINEKV